MRTLALSGTAQETLVALELAWHSHVKSILCVFDDNVGCERAGEQLFRYSGLDRRWRWKAKNEAALTR